MASGQNIKKARLTSLEAEVVKNKNIIRGPGKNKIKLILPAVAFAVKKTVRRP
jgi:hypothetical protein